jgi:hypothetical protein
MTGIPEAFVATPLGVLRVWATSEHILRAATLPGWVKTRPPYRDDPQAQRCAELVTIDQTSYSLRLWLHSSDWSGGRGAWATHRGWVLPRGAVELARDSGLAPVPAARSRAGVHVLPAVAAWADSPAGRRLRLGAGRQAIQRDLAAVGREITALQALRARLRQHDQQLLRRLGDHPARSRGGDHDGA